ncbi:SDR family oxidoreductase [Paenibacillus sp. IB182496]|uniref:SDR family oxidoreductase n=1 Tax=Paenibacillus sabuli TaxID=2772509 RepID=A0A927BQY0_9BACL|nr:SDR family NAD(P)-dependent oxidoreductase [Paenibacillus sabuli]MBD2845113.1 SDR family oxidoreductase [Paenibacillus sabuli]
MLLAQRTALITGAGGSLGAAIAERFAAEGCRLIVADIREEAAQETVRRLRDSGAPAAAVRMDATNEDEVREVFGDLDSLDILVNNAGRTKGGMMEQIALEEWNELLTLNLTTVFLCTKHALPLLRRSATPAIVNIASINALRMNPGLPAYAAAKSGVIALTEQTVLEGAKDCIRANCISPGLTISRERQAARVGGEDTEADLDCYPLGRLGVPEDVANAALFLASDMSAFVNGTNLIVDGGMSVQAVSSLLRPSMRRRWKPIIKEEESTNEN